MPDDWYSRLVGHLESARRFLGGDPTVAGTVSTAANLLGPGRAPVAVARPASGIRAYHGSPYDFTRFDWSKIGTGEGAQSYSHGLYFAGAEPTAQTYKERLAAVAHGVGSPEWLAANRLNIFGTPKEAIRSLREWTMGLPQQDIQSAINLIETGFAPAKGHMYEVNIRAEPGQLLDWDRPVLDQPQPVRSALENIYGKNLSGLHAERLTEPGSALYHDLAQQAGGERLISSSAGPYPVRYADPERASSILREAGIPGVRYLDQLSRTPSSDFTVWAPRLGRNEQFEVRGPGNEVRGNFATREEARAFADEENAKANPQTHNYVLFRDDIIDILRKYGIIGTAAPAAASMATDDGEPSNQAADLYARGMISDKALSKFNQP